MSRCSRIMCACLTWFCSRNAGGVCGGLGGGEVDQLGLDRGDVPGQLGGVEACEEFLKLGVRGGGEDAGVGDALVGGAGLVVDADVAPVPVRPVSDGFGGPGEQVQPEPDGGWVQGCRWVPGVRSRRSTSASTRRRRRRSGGGCWTSWSRPRAGRAVSYT